MRCGEDEGAEATAVFIIPVIFFGFVPGDAGVGGVEKVGSGKAGTSVSEIHPAMMGVEKENFALAGKAGADVKAFVGFWGNRDDPAGPVCARISGGGNVEGVAFVAVWRRICISDDERPGGARVTKVDRDGAEVAGIIATVGDGGDVRPMGAGVGGVEEAVVEEIPAGGRSEELEGLLSVGREREDEESEKEREARDEEAHDVERDGEGSAEGIVLQSKD